MDQQAEPDGTRVTVPRYWCREDIEALRKRDRWDRQRPLVWAYCLALAVAAVTGLGVLGELRRAEVPVPEGRGASATP